MEPCSLCGLAPCFGLCITRDPFRIRRGPCVTGLEAAKLLNISFGRFKVMVWRGLELDPLKKPNGNEPKPVTGGWSAKSATYLVSDIEKAKALYNFKAPRTPHCLKVRIHLDEWEMVGLKYLAEFGKAQAKGLGLTEQVNPATILRGLVRAAICESPLMGSRNFMQLMPKEARKGLLDSASAYA